jgi:DNA replication protein DnaC
MVSIAALEQSRSLASDETEGAENHAYMVRIARKAVGGRYAKADDLGRAFELYDARQKPALAAVRQYVAELASNIEHGRNLVLIGPSGVGKDLLASHVLLRAAIEHGYWVGQGNATDLVRRSMVATKFARVRGDIEGPAVFCVSDIAYAALPRLDFETTLIGDLIDCRYRASKPTIVTLNAEGVDHGCALVGAPAMERLAESAVVISCVWPSYRRRQIEAAKGANR